MLSSKTKDRLQSGQRACGPHQSAGIKASVFNILLLLVFFWGYHPFSLTKVPDQVACDDDLPQAAQLPNFHRVHSYLFRGGAPRMGGLMRLKELGVKTIIDLRVNPMLVAAESQTACQLGIKYINLPTGNYIPPVSHQQVFFQVLEQSAQNPAEGPVFVHCAHGSDRTGFVVALWRVNHDHWSVGQSIQEMFRYGFQIHKLHLPFSKGQPATPIKEAGQFD